jgi:hypothetical protein
LLLHCRARVLTETIGDTANGTLSYELTKHLWVGSNGYFLKQITDPTINGVDISNSPEQVKAIGPGMVWNHGEWFLYVNGYHEFGAEKPCYRQQGCT